MNLKIKPTEYYRNRPDDEDIGRTATVYPSTHTTPAAKARQPAVVHQIRRLVLRTLQPRRQPGAGPRLAGPLSPLSQAHCRLASAGKGTASDVKLSNRIKGTTINCDVYTPTGMHWCRCHQAHKAGNCQHHNHVHPTVDWALIPYVALTLMFLMAALIQEAAAMLGIEMPMPGL